MRHLRNAAIVMLLALGVAFVPGGGNAADTAITALTVAFLAVIAWAVYALGRREQMTLAALPDSRRAVLYGALGLIALLIAGSDRFFDSGGGTLAWFALIAAAGAAIWLIWREANTYS